MTDATPEAAQPPLRSQEDLYAERIVRMACAYLGANAVPIDKIGDVVVAITEALVGADAGSKKPARDRQNPAVPIKKSYGDDFIVCLEDGKRLTMLKRYLRTQFDMSPAEYRAKWNLPPDYPMVAPAYARLRSEFAKKIGLGRIPTK